MAGGARSLREHAAVPLKRSGLTTQAVLLGAAAVVLILLMDLYVRDSPRPINDQLIYELMAQHPFDPHTFPFAYRVGVPTLVHVLPFGHTFSFSALAWLSSGFVAGIGYVLLRRFDVPPWVSAGLALAIAVSPGMLVVSIRQGRNVDPESVVVLMAGTLAIVDRRPRALALIAFVGVFVRETALFLLPLAYAVWAQRPVDLKALRQVALGFAPAVVAYAALRASVPAPYRERVIGYAGSAIEGRRAVLSAAKNEWKAEVRRVFSVFGPLWFLLPQALRESAFVRRGMVLFACCLFSFLFALDWGRLIFLFVPVMLVAGGVVLRSRPRLAVMVLVALVALDLVYLVYMEDFGGAQDGIIDQPPTSYPST